MSYFSNGFDQIGWFVVLFAWLVFGTYSLPTVMRVYGRMIGQGESFNQIPYSHSCLINFAAIACSEIFCFVFFDFAARNNIKLASFVFGPDNSANYGKVVELSLFLTIFSVILVLVLRRFLGTSLVRAILIAFLYVLLFSLTTIAVLATIGKAFTLLK